MNAQTQPIVNIDNLVSDSHLDEARHSIKEYRAQEVSVIDSDDMTYTSVALALPCECGRWIEQADQD